MSQQPKQNFFQTLLIVTTIFLGLNLLMNSQKQPSDVRTSDQILQDMRKLSAEIKDVSIASQLQAYLGKLTSEAERDKTPKEVVDQKKLEAHTLVAYTQFKAGVQRHDYNRLTMSYVSMVGEHRTLQDSPVWKQAFDIPVSSNPETAKEFPDTKLSASDAYAKIVGELSARNRTDLVWGIMNGHTVIDTLVRLTGAVPGFSYWFAALLLAFVVRSAVWPLTQKQLMFSRQMQQLLPLTKEIKEKFGKDPMEVQAKTMELYKEYGINPMQGCWPAFIQLPLFLFVYQCMVQYRFDFQKGTFLWVNPLTGINTHGWTARNLGEQDFTFIVIYGITMIITTLLAPVSDPTQQKQQKIMGLSIAVIFSIGMFFYPLPSAFVLYWIFTNILSTAQSLRAYRMPVPPLRKVNAPNGAVYPVGGNGSNGKMNGLFQSTGAPKVQKPKKKK